MAKTKTIKGVQYVKDDDGAFTAQFPITLSDLVYYDIDSKKTIEEYFESKMNGINKIKGGIENISDVTSLSELHSGDIYFVRNSGSANIGHIGEDGQPTSVTVNAYDAIQYNGEYWSVLDGITITMDIDAYTKAETYSVKEYNEKIRELSNTFYTKAQVNNLFGTPINTAYAKAINIYGE